MAEQDGGRSTVRAALLADEALVRAVVTGRRKGAAQPAVGGREVRRVELRYVDLKSGRHLQVTSYDEAQAHTANHASGDAAVTAVDDLLAQPFANWHLDTTTHTHQARVTKRGEMLVHSKARDEAVSTDRGHDREKHRLLAEDDPVLRELGISDAQGRIKPTRQAKYRQVEEFLRLLDAAIEDARSAGHLRKPTPEQPLRIVDLGCGNAYLTFAAERYLSHVRGLPVRVIGVDVKQQAAEHNSAVAARLGIEAEFVVGSIADMSLPEPPDVVLALHACDTATDEALARAVKWDAGLVLAAPCCHHDIAAQLRRSPTPAPYSLLTGNGILRERFADTLTDALRAAILRQLGYRVDVVEFVESAHTPRNTLIRATRTGRAGTPETRAEYDDLVATWDITPRLAELVDLRGA